MTMTSLLTAEAVAVQAAALHAAAPHQQQQQPYSCSSGVFGSSGGGLGLPCSVPEDKLGENPRSSWRLVTGHENGQLLLWCAALDCLQPLVNVGDPGTSPVRAVSVMESQRLVAVMHANGELALFARPARDQDWLLVPSTATTADAAAAAAAGDAAAAASSAGGTLRQPGSSSGGGALHTGMAEAAASSTPAAGQHTPAAERQGTGTGASGSKASTPAAAALLSTIKPRRVLIKTHRSMLVAAAACGSGVVTSSALGSIRLWPAQGLGKEAERCGLVQPGLLAHAASRDSRCAVVHTHVTTHTHTTPEREHTPSEFGACCIEGSGVQCSLLTSHGGRVVFGCIQQPATVSACSCVACL